MICVNLTMLRRTIIEALGTVEELQSHTWLFEDIFDGPRIGAVTAKLGCKMSQNLTYGIKKGAKKFAPQNLVAFPTQNFT